MELFRLIFIGLRWNDTTWLTSCHNLSRIQLMNGTGWDPRPACIGLSCGGFYGVRSTEYIQLCWDFPEIEPTRTFRRTILTSSHDGTVCKLPHTLNRTMAWRWGWIELNTFPLPLRRLGQCCGPPPHHWCWSIDLSFLGFMISNILSRMAPDFTSRGIWHARLQLATEGIHVDIYPCREGH